MLKCPFFSNGWLSVPKDTTLVTLSYTVDGDYEGDDENGSCKGKKNASYTVSLLFMARQKYDPDNTIIGFMLLYFLIQENAFEYVDNVNRSRSRNSTPLHVFARE